MVQQIKNSRDTQPLSKNELMKLAQSKDICDLQMLSLLYNSESRPSINRRRDLYDVIECGIQSIQEIIEKDRSMGLSWFFLWSDATRLLNTSPEFRKKNWRLVSPMDLKFKIRLLLNGHKMSSVEMNYLIDDIYSEIFAGEYWHQFDIVLNYFRRLPTAIQSIVYQSLRNVKTITFLSLIRHKKIHRLNKAMLDTIIEEHISRAQKLHETLAFYKYFTDRKIVRDDLRIAIRKLADPQSVVAEPHEDMIEFFSIEELEKFHRRVIVEDMYIFYDNLPFYRDTFPIMFSDKKLIDKTVSAFIAWCDRWSHGNKIYSISEVAWRIVSHPMLNAIVKLQPIFSDPALCAELLFSERSLLSLNAGKDVARYAWRLYLEGIVKPVKITSIKNECPEDILDELSFVFHLAIAEDWNSIESRMGRHALATSAFFAGKKLAYEALQILYSMAHSSKPDARIFVRKILSITLSLNTTATSVAVV